METVTKKSRVKKIKLRTETVHLDDFEDYEVNLAEVFGGFDSSFITDATSTSELYEKLEVFLKAQGWTLQEHWYTSDSNASRFSADAVSSAVNHGRTQALIVDDDNAYFWSK